MNTAQTPVTPAPATRRQMLRTSIGASLAALVAAGEVFADEPLFGTRADLEKEIDKALADFSVEDLELIDAEFKVQELRYAGEPLPLESGVVNAFVTEQFNKAGEECATTMVPTVERARWACHSALRSGRFSQARIAVAQRDQQGRIVFPQDGDGLVRAAAVYTSPMQVGAHGMDQQLNAEWNDMLASIGDDEASALRDSDNSLDIWTPEQGLSLDDPLMHAGGLSGARKPCYSNSQMRMRYCNTPGSRQGLSGYSYANHCQGGSCSLRPLGTVAGLLQGEFLRPLSSAGGIRHLPLGKRIVARLFPRIAYRQGWVNCQTAHLLLVKRLFWAIVIGVAIGTAGGGSGAAAGAAGGGSSSGGGGLGAAVIFLG